MMSANSAVRLMPARAEATASALDSGIYRYTPFSIFSFMDCLTASGVTAASRTVSTVCERRVSTPSALTFAAACGTVGLPTGIVVDVSDVLAGACTLAARDFTFYPSLAASREAEQKRLYVLNSLLAYFLSYKPSNICHMLRRIRDGFHNVICAVYRFAEHNCFGRAVFAILICYIGLRPSSMAESALPSSPCRRRMCSAIRCSRTV